MNQVYNAQPEEVLTVSKFEPEDIISMALARVDQIKKLKEVALKMTNNNDWVDMGGKPYMVSAGAEKVGRMFGVKITDTRYKKEIGNDDLGMYYFYVYTGVCKLSNDIDGIECVGTCSSRDPFFAKVSGEWKVMSEIDETNIMKAAYTNMTTNGITRLLGLRNMTWDEVRGAGIDQSKAGKVDYSKKVEDESKETAEKRKKKIQEIANMLGEIFNNDKEQMATAIAKITVFTGRDGKEVAGVRSIKAMQNWKFSRVSIAHKGVEDLYKEFQQMAKDAGKGQQSILDKKEDDKAEKEQA